MTTMKRRSAKRGAMAQQNFESVKGFCKNVALNIQADGINSEYFANVYIGFLADSSGLKKAEGENIATFDGRADKMAADKFAAMLESEEGRAALQNSAVFATMANKEAMYKVFRESLPCYTEGGKFSFAKPKNIAVRVSDLTAEERAEYDKKTNVTKTAIFIDGNDIEYYCAAAYAANIEEELQTMYKSRRAFLAEEKEQTKAFFKANGRYIYTLAAINKGTFKEFAPALSVSLQEEAAAIRRRRAKAAEESRKAAEAAEAAALFLNTEAAAKLADLAKIAEGMAAAKDANTYGRKAAEAAARRANGILKAIQGKGEAAKAYYLNLAEESAKAKAAAFDKAEAAEANATAAAAASNPETAEESHKAAREYNEAAKAAEAAEISAEANAAQCTRHLAAAALLCQRITNEETAAADLRRAAAPYLSGEAAEANKAAINAAAPESAEAAKPKRKGQRKGAKNQAEAAANAAA